MKIKDRKAWKNGEEILQMKQMNRPHFASSCSFIIELQLQKKKKKKSKLLQT